jgi:toxin
VLLIGYAGFRLASGNHEPIVPKRQPIERVSLDANNRHDLTGDEARGGHTLQRHVGKTDAELRERLQSEDVSAASSYTDRATAEMAVAAAIRENSEKINRWLQHPGGHSNLVLDYDSNSPIGRSMRREEAQSFPCSHAVAVLKFVGAGEYYVLTSYPDCWKPS